MRVSMGGLNSGFRHLGSVAVGTAEGIRLSRGALSRGLPRFRALVYYSILRYVILCYKA